MAEYLSLALSSFLSIDVFLGLLVGVVGGMIIGIIPGLGPSVGIALLLPISFSMSPTAALVMMTAMYKPVCTADPSLLFCAIHQVPRHLRRPHRMAMK